MERGLRPLTLSSSRIAGDLLRPGCGPGDVPGYPYIRITRSGPSRNGHGLLPAPDPRPICILPPARPYNAPRRSEALGLDYRTIRHHLDLLQKNGLITQPASSAYAAPYFLAQYLEANYAIFEEIRRKAFPKEGDAR